MTGDHRVGGLVAVLGGGVAVGAEDTRFREIRQAFGERRQLALGARHAGGNGVGRHQQDAEALVIGEVVLLDIVDAPLAGGLADAEAVDTDPRGQLGAVFSFKRVIHRDHGNPRLGEHVNGRLAQVLVRQADEHAVDLIRDHRVEQVHIRRGILVAVHKLPGVAGVLNHLLGGRSLLDKPGRRTHLVDADNRFVACGHGIGGRALRRCGSAVCRRGLRFRGGRGRRGAAAGGHRRQHRYGKPCRKRFQK